MQETYTMKKKLIQSPIIDIIKLGYCWSFIILLFCCCSYFYSW